MKTLGSIESFTGGAFAAAITSVPGASKYYKGSVITYATELKEKIGVDTSRGVVNAKVAQEMSMKGKEFLGVDTCISFTGNAGPIPMEDKPVGLVYIGINGIVHKKNFTGTRKEIINKAVQFAIEIWRGE
ncbi:CinA family protein [Mycoplasma todarodis]|uniref:CinA family protein n=1 Tax=Mycoplasma todarodis TaxID=1937191 RepID=A0A4R0XJX8_9MOLU|nr:nicotinamide-nucleotide amidohydrolase family protein [Mycoplasma todarodis]TCG10754.1 CinA family protein [Mycoplasma todarodis]